MNTTTIAVDLAKSVFQAHVANDAGHVVDKKRLTRHQFRKLLYTVPVSTIVMVYVPAGINPGMSCSSPTPVMYHRPTSA